MTLSEAIEVFIHKKHLEGLQDKTIENYKVFLQYFLKFSGNIDLKELSYSDLESYQLDLLQRNLSRATVATYNRHLKCFLRFIEKCPETRKHLNKIIYRKDHPLLSERIKICKSPSRRCLILNPNEISNIFDLVKEKYKEPLYTRNMLIIALMLDCGLRQEEVVNLTYNRINLEDKLINVYGKGEKERIVPFGEFTKELISKYITLNHRCYKNSKSPLLYTIKGEPLSQNSIKIMINRISRASQINFSSHTLRHNFATNWCIDEYNRCGIIDIYRLKLLLGHEDLKTTFRYLHMAQEIIISKNNISHLDYIQVSNSV